MYDYYACVAPRAHAIDSAAINCAHWIQKMIHDNDDPFRMDSGWGRSATARILIIYHTRYYKQRRQHQQQIRSSIHICTPPARWIKFHRHKRRKRSMAFRTTCGCLYWWWSVMEQGEKTWALRIVFRWHWHNTIPTTSPGYCVSHWRRSKVKRKTKRAAVDSSSSIVHIIGRTQKKSWKTERKKILRKDSPSSCMAHHGSFCFFLLSLSLLEHSLVPSFHRL